MISDGCRASSFKNDVYWHVLNSSGSCSD